IVARAFRFARSSHDPEVIRLRRLHPEQQRLVVRLVEIDRRGQPVARVEAELDARSRQPLEIGGPFDDADGRDLLAQASLRLDRARALLRRTAAHAAFYVAATSTGRGHST